MLNKTVKEAYLILLSVFSRFSSNTSRSVQVWKQNLQVCGNWMQSLSTPIGLIYNRDFPIKLHDTLKLLTLRLHLYIFKQKEVIFNTCSIVRMLSAEKWIRSARWGIQTLLKPAKQLWHHNNNNNNKSETGSESKVTILCNQQLKTDRSNHNNKSYIITRGIEDNMSVNRNCNFKKQKCDKEGNQKYFEIQRPCKINTACVKYKNKSGTINNGGNWKHLKISQNISELYTWKHDIKEIQKTAISGTVQILRKIVT